MTKEDGTSVEQVQMESTDEMVDAEDWEEKMDYYASDELY